ncbi:patatin-like phospholipase family protein [Kitasatospora indigofera]|uniref:patatin-like phospholipase family protein n=1 Tax=Kitasatospora indigofera TaxID=67307 RepID=UPI0036AC54AB
MEQRALVIGGGGIVGCAWAAGLLAGLAQAGADLSGADLVVGTSAGALLGAQLTSGVTPAELHRQQLGDPADTPAVGITAVQGARFLLAALAGSQERAVRRLGRAALAARTVPEEDVLAVVGSLVGVTEWPRRPLRLVAVDARTGAPAVLDAGSGVGLVRAVAASCALPIVWPPITVGRQRLVDGGIRSTANADLARGHRRIAVIAPVPSPPGPSPSAARQAEELRDGGAEVVLLVPGREARRVFGRKLMDPARRAAAAAAGHAEGLARAAEVAAVWQG